MSMNIKWHTFLPILLYVVHFRCIRSLSSTKLIMSFGPTELLFVWLEIVEIENTYASTVRMYVRTYVRMSFMWYARSRTYVQTS